MLTVLCGFTYSSFPRIYIYIYMPKKKTKSFVLVMYFVFSSTIFNFIFLNDFFLDKKEIF